MPCSRTLKQRRYFYWWSWWKLLQICCPKIDKYTLKNYIKTEEMLEKEASRGIQQKYLTIWQPGWEENEEERVNFPILELECFVKKRLGGFGLHLFQHMEKMFKNRYEFGLTRAVAQSSPSGFASATHYIRHPRAMKPR